MRIGVTGGPNEWKIASSLGYDYCEVNLSWVASLGDAEFENACNLLQKTKLKAETFNGFFSGDVKLYEASDEWLKAYTSLAFSRAKRMGGEILVLGSSVARNVPENMKMSDAEEKFSHVLSVCGDVANSFGMKVVIEPLRREECNFINTLSESVSMCKKTNHKDVGTLVDFFHFYCNGESLEDINDAAPLLWHTHLARPNPDRGAPTVEDAGLILPYAEALKKIEYQGRITLECRWLPDYETAITNAFKVMDIFRNI